MANPRRRSGATLRPVIGILPVIIAIIIIILAWHAHGYCMCVCECECALSRSASAAQCVRDAARRLACELARYRGVRENDSSLSIALISLLADQLHGFVVSALT